MIGPMESLRSPMFREADGPHVLRLVVSRGETPECEVEGSNAADRADTMPKKAIKKAEKSKGAKPDSGSEPFPVDPIVLPTRAEAERLKEWARSGQGEGAK